MTKTPSDILSLMDVLYIDENVIDERLSVIMNRDCYEEKHLFNATILLNYKLLLNEAESEDCDNEKEYNFLFKLIQHACDENVDMVCKITKLTLLLNKTSLTSKVQHLLQQLLPYISDNNEINGDTELELKTTYNNLRLFDCLLDVLIDINTPITLHVVSASFENIMNSLDESLVKYFLLNTVPRIVTVLPEIHILENIWKYIISMQQEEWVKSLKYLTTLADLYFSLNEMMLIEQPQFWELILQGLYSSKIDYRKSSLYLIKRSLEILAKPNSININKANDNGCNKLNWEKNKNYFKEFITLFECLEEQQSNIVLPALYIFENIKDMDKVWLNSLFKLGLGHNSKQVKLKCLQEFLKHCVITLQEAEMFLNFMNDMSLFNCTSEVDTIIENYQLIDFESLLNIFATIPKIVWSPIPLHYVVGATIDFLLTRTKDARNVSEKSMILENITMLYQVLSDINEMSCNIPLIRENLHHKAAELFVELSKGSNWRDLKCLRTVDPKKFPKNGRCAYKLNDIIVNNGEEKEFVDIMLLSPVNMMIASPFLGNSPRCTEVLSEKIMEKFREIEMVVHSTNYMDLTKYLEQMDFINICCQYYHHISLSPPDQIPYSNTLIIAYTIKENLITLIEYMHSILSHSQKISYEDGSKLCETFKNITNLIIYYQPDDRLLQFNKSILSLHQNCVQIANNKTGDIERTILCYKVMNNLYEFLTLHFPQGEAEIPRSNALKFNKIMNDMKRHHNEERSLSHIFNHEYWCLLSKFEGDTLLNVFELEVSASACLDTVLIDAIEICDNTSLKFVLIVATNLLNNPRSEIVDVKKLLSTIWKRINDIKSLSKEYFKCLNIFTSLFLSKTIIKNQSNNDLVLSFFKEILELSSNSVGNYNNLLKHVCRINAADIDIEPLSEMISEALIFSPYQRRDQIILDRVLKSLKKEMKIDDYHNADKMNYTFKLIAVQECNILKNVLNLTKKKIDARLHNKQRYHQGSQAHKELFNSLKLMLLIGCCVNRTIDKEAFDWCTGLLCRLPHQPDVKACLEWYISLYFCSKELSLNERTSQIMLNELPTASKFLILYHVLKHRLINKIYSLDDYEYVMEMLLSSIMGPTFNLRLQAQCLAKELFQILPTQKYAYTITLITKALAESEDEKNYIKNKNDYFFNDFDLVRDLNFEFIYNVLPCLYGGNEIEDLSKFSNMKSLIQERFARYNSSNFFQMWLRHQSDKSDNYRSINFKKISDKCDAAESKEEFTCVIQKKYIPWKNMCDIDVYEADHHKNGKHGDMIVVASLVDKLPNLGGMARTSEVFAVKTLVIDSLRHVQDRQFQGLSMSAERWVDIEEVRPGQHLKDYLLKMKAEGYVIVAAEQASTSVQLQAFQFPKKCLLLLGNEKNGVPCDLLPYMDFCVEIPQQGFVRSLNVHVTAAIFIWEYTKQHLSLS